MGYTKKLVVSNKNKLADFGSSLHEISALLSSITDHHHNKDLVKYLYIES